MTVKEMPKNHKSFRQEKLWKVVCYKCKKEYANNDNVCDYFKTKGEAIEAIEMDNWWHMKGDKAYCEQCYKY